ncbi:MAG TPA: diguanylate cyclase, partial [Candidatus Obscuribacter sp.]|nr:diguanylate cyclase [Candidatus Obscuribacter sp.]
IAQTQSDLDVVDLVQPEPFTVAAPPSNGFSLPNAGTSWPGQISSDRNPAKPSEKAPEKPQTSPVMAVGLPPSPVALKLKVGKHSLDLLNNPDTSLLRHDVFEYLLAMEFARACRFGSSLSLVVFCLRVPQAASQTIPLSQLLTVLGQVDNLRREVDVFGHFGDRTFALLLPNVEPEQAAGLADRLNRELSGLLSPESTGGVAPLSLHFGIAGAPLDATELSALSMAAQVAMKASVDAGSLRTLYSQLKR